MKKITEFIFGLSVAIIGSIIIAYGIIMWVMMFNRTLIGFTTIQNVIS